MAREGRGEEEEARKEGKEGGWLLIAMLDSVALLVLC